MATVPASTVERSRFIITGHHKLLKRIRPLAEKAQRRHEYRNSLTTVERKGVCDWCNKTRKANPLHFF